MTLPPSRALRIALLALVTTSLVSSLPAQQPTKRPAPKPALSTNKPAPVPWLYKGSDIPVDAEWNFGELPNGLRYAVRRNGVPPGQVSIRVAIDAGSIHEGDTELGFAHFIEHLSFRGSKYMADGEAKRTWQRLGASFGSDTNASTTPTQTIYRLDLPAATPAALEDSMKILSGMMAEPTISQAEVDTERRTVLAEAREQRGPQAVAGDAVRSLFYGGQRLGVRPTIGTDEALSAATAQSLRAFHDRWYRPEKTVISISGDTDPSQVIALISKYFGGWKGKGPLTPDPDFGDPSPTARATHYLTEAGLPTLVQMGWFRPWRPRDDTIALNQGRMVDLVARLIINRRLEQRARAGGSFLQAGIDQQEVARSSDGTFVSILPAGDNWQAALADVRSVLADAIANPPTQAEIDREMGEAAAALDIQVETARAEPSSKQADDIVEAVNIRETVASPEVARDVFGGMKGRITPAAVVASTKKLLSGAGPRVFVTSPQAANGGDALIAAEIAKPVKSTATSTVANVSFDDLPKLGAPGVVIKSEELTPGFRVERLELSNGVTAMLDPNKGEAGRVYVQVRFGAGRRTMPKSAIPSVWAAESALVAGGIGKLKQDSLDRLTSGRQINLNFDVADDAFLLRSNTRDADLKDQLRLLAALMQEPGWDPAPLARAKAAALIGIATVDSSPNGVLAGELPVLLRGGDLRWGQPKRADIDALNPESFRKTWQPLLASGPVEVSIFGDFDRSSAVEALRQTFGAMAPRPAATFAAGGDVIAPIKPISSPLIRYHKGSAEQALAVLAWPTGSGRSDGGAFESRQLDVLAQIFADRLFEQFREGEGASYSPDVSSAWPFGTKGGGSLTVMSLVKPETVPAFYTRAKAIAADLVAKPVSADELERAVGPMRQNLARATSGNTFWLSQLSGATRDPLRIETLKSWPSDMRRMTPEGIQAVAKKYLIPGKTTAITILPEKK